MAKVTKVEAGTKIPVTNRDGREVEVTVLPNCGAKSGQWICITHYEDVSLMNQFEKNTHTSEGDHVMAWFCPFDGLEVP